jgi:hypothetical protein
VALAAPWNDFGEEEEAPELESLPEGEANRVQSDASEPLLTVIATGELVVETPAASVALAVRVWEPLERELVLRDVDQVEVPEVVAKEPLSTESCTELMETLSEAVPETVVMPETVEPLEGEVMVTDGEEMAILMLRLADAEAAAASLTCAEKENEPAEVGVPEMAPLLARVRPEGSAPEAMLHV